MDIYLMIRLLALDSHLVPPIHDRQWELLNQQILLLRSVPLDWEGRIRCWPFFGEKGFT